MRLAFQAGTDIDPDIVRGPWRREPSIDFRSAAGVLPEGAPDSEVLHIAAQAGRVLVTSDVRTMRLHFRSFIAQHESPGVLLIPSSRSIGDSIEGLLVVWLTWSPVDLRNQMWWLP